MFYRTEEDLRHEQEQTSTNSRPWSTPDFLFVDAQGTPVRVPVKLKESSTALADFHATVLEVKGHFILPGLSTNDHDIAKLTRQIGRYHTYFGPPLVLQKHGACEQVLLALAHAFQHWAHDHANGCGGGGKGRGGGGSATSCPPLAVLPFDRLKLPESKKPNPWDKCPMKDCHQFTNGEAVLLQSWGASCPEGAASGDDRLAIKTAHDRAVALLRAHHWGRSSLVGRDPLKTRAEKGVDYGGWRGRLIEKHLKEAQHAARIPRADGSGGGGDDGSTEAEAAVPEVRPEFMLASLQRPGTTPDAWDEGLPPSPLPHAAAEEGPSPSVSSSVDLLGDEA